MRNVSLRRRFDPCTVILLCTAAVCAGMLVYRLFVTSRTLYNTDAATLSVYAHEVLAAHSLFPAGWAYNNGDVWLYNAVIFIIPLITVAQNDYNTYALATSLYSCLMLIGIYWGARQMHVPVRPAVLLVAIVATGIASPFLADLLFDWGANYGAQFFITFLQTVALVGVMRWRPEDTRAKLFWISAFFCILVLVGAISNGSRAMVYQVAPFLLGLAIVGMHQRRKGESADVRRYCLAALLVIVPFAAGSAINALIIGRPSGWGLNSPRVYAANDLISHLETVCTSVLFMLGYPLKTWANLLGNVIRIPLLSPAGLWLCVRIAGAFFLAWFAYVFIRRTLSARSTSFSLFVYSIVSIVGLALALFVHVFAFRYPAEDYESVRYLFTPLMLVLIGGFFLFAEAIDERLGPAWAAALAGGFLVLLAFMNHVYPGFVRLPSGSTEFARTDKDEIVQCLESNGLKYGYGSLWLSHVFTILSDYKVVVRPVFPLADNRRMVREPIHSMKRWYEPGAWRGPSFLLLDNLDLSTMPPTWVDLFGPPSRHFACGSNQPPQMVGPIPESTPGPVQVFEYPYNIGPRIPAT